MGWKVRVSERETETETERGWGGECTCCSLQGPAGGQVTIKGLEVHHRVSESLSLLHTISTQHRVVKIEEGVTNPSWKSPGRRQ